MTLSCSTIVDRKDHVQYLTVVVIVNLSCLYMMIKQLFSGKQTASFYSVLSSYHIEHVAIENAFHNQ